jgi:hypothetical protein
VTGLILRAQIRVLSPITASCGVVLAAARSVQAAGHAGTGEFSPGVQKCVGYLSVYSVVVLRRVEVTEHVGQLSAVVGQHLAGAVAGRDPGEAVGVGAAGPDR